MRLGFRAFKPPGYQKPIKQLSGATDKTGVAPYAGTEVFMLFGRPEIETIRAALLYWQQEICPHGELAARPYLEGDHIRPLSAAEIDSLRTCLTGDFRYANFVLAEGQMLSRKVWQSPDDAASEAGDHAGVVTVLLLPPAVTTLS